MHNRTFTIAGSIAAAAALTLLLILATADRSGPATSWDIALGAAAVLSGMASLRWFSDGALLRAIDKRLPKFADGVQLVVDRLAAALPQPKGPGKD